MSIYEYFGSTQETLCMYFIMTSHIMIFSTNVSYFVLMRYCIRALGLPTELSGSVEVQETGLTVTSVIYTNT